MERLLPALSAGQVGSHDMDGMNVSIMAPVKAGHMHRMEEPGSPPPFLLHWWSWWPGSGHHVTTTLLLGNFLSPTA
jgi:hypothetical protein